MNYISIHFLYILEGFSFFIGNTLKLPPVDDLKFQAPVACNKRSRRTEQIQTRLSDLGLPCLLFLEAFCKFHL